MIRRLFVVVLLFATASTVDLDSQKRDDKVCDDGVHLIEKDLGDSHNWFCQGTNIIIKTVSSLADSIQHITLSNHHSFFSSTRRQDTHPAKTRCRSAQRF